MADLKFITRNKNLISVTGLASVNGSDSLFFYKQGEDGAAIAAEATEHQRVQQVTANIAGIRAPEFRLYDEQQNVLVMEHVKNTTSLFNHLWNNTRWLDIRRFRGFDPLDAGLRLGKWLNCYHASTSRLEPDIDPYCLWLLESSFQKIQALISGNSGFLSPTTADNVVERLKQLEIGAHSIGPQIVGRIHGDLELFANILVTGSRELIVIDFGYSREGLVLEDIFRLWNSIWVISKTSRLRHRLLTPCLESLLNAYGISWSAVDPTLIALLRIWNYLCSLLALAAFQTGFRFGDRSYVSRLVKVYQECLVAEVTL